MTRLATAVLTLSLACTPAARPPQGAPPPESAPPRLVVLLVLDQWPEWAFDAKRPAFAHGGGFERLLSEGEWHTGLHPSAATLTAPGHALLGTGEPPYHSGILANSWWHRDPGKHLSAVELADGTTTDSYLRVPGLGDAIAAAHTGAHAVAVSLKERASILVLGHAGTRIWYDAKAAAWDAYGGAPAWLATYNQQHPVAARLHEPWVPADPAAVARLSGLTDDAPGELGEKRFGPTFPHDPQATSFPADAVFAMPLGNELVLETALAALDGEHLGADAIPDYLAVSLSAHDYVGHGWGQESWEMWDMELRLDRQLADFMAALDAKVGAGQWAMVVTSDHGASPMPERMPHGGRIFYGQIAAAANRAAQAELGSGDWISDAFYPSVYLSAAALAQPPHDREQALKKIVLALRSFPGIERVGKTADLAGHCETRTGSDFTICIALDPERSGEVAYFPAPGTILQDDDEPEATAHGSLHDYDRVVPVILLPPGRHAHAPLAAHDATQIYMPHLAAVIARWLGVSPPTSLPR